MKELLCSFTVPNHLFRPSKNPGHRQLVQTNTFACSNIVTVCIPGPFLWGSKSILFSLFQNKKASFKGIYTLNGIHMWVFINIESLNARATHFKTLQGFTSNSVWISYIMQNIYMISFIDVYM